MFHGWQFDMEGRPVELPNVPPGTNYQRTIRLTAYPTREYGEIVWAYLGPRDGTDGDGGDTLPEVPALEFGAMPDASSQACQLKPGAVVARSASMTLL